MEIFSKVLCNIVYGAPNNSYYNLPSFSLLPETCPWSMAAKLFVLALLVSIFSVKSGRSDFLDEILDAESTTLSSTTTNDLNDVLADIGNDHEDEDEDEETTEATVEGQQGQSGSLDEILGQDKNNTKPTEHPIQSALLWPGESADYEGSEFGYEYDQGQEDFYYDSTTEDYDSSAEVYDSTTESSTKLSDTTSTTTDDKASNDVGEGCVKG